MSRPHRSVAATATNTSRALATYAASTAVLQLQALIAGSRDPVGREVRAVAAPWRLLETRLVRARDCRGAHDPWVIEPADPALTLREILARVGAGPEAVLRIAGSEWVRTLRCSCGEESAFWRAAESMFAAQPRCARCGSRLPLQSFDLRSALPVASLPPAVVERTLRELGLRMRDVISVECASDSFHFELSTKETARGADPGIVVIGGLGAVGSAAAPLVACTTGVRCIVLIDPDCYEAANLAGQTVTPDAVGQPKVAYQAAQLRALRPDLDVVPIDRRLEDVPLGIFRDAVVIGCLDSRIARLELTARATRVAAFQIDVGLDAATNHVRVQTFEPGRDRACLLCGWSDLDFEALEETLPCDAARIAREEERAWTPSSPAS